MVVVNLEFPMHFFIATLERCSTRALGDIAFRTRDLLALLVHRGQIRNMVSSRLADQFALPMLHLLKLI